MKKRILIVEDDAIIVYDLVERLQERGYEIAGIADSGNLAIDMVKRLKPDLLLLDVCVKGDLNGIEAAIVLQSTFEDTLPVVFLTGLSEQAFPYLKVLNDYVYVNKPYTEAELFEALDRAIHHMRKQGYLTDTAQGTYG